MSGNSCESALQTAPIVSALPAPCGGGSGPTGAPPSPSGGAGGSWARVSSAIA